MNLEESYKELGLGADSSDAEVKAAWRRLAARWHPDRNASPHALRKIQRINRALEEIRRFRASSFGPLDEGPPSQSPGPATDPPGRNGASPGRTLDHTLHLSIEEAFAGCIRDLVGQVVDDCVACVGSGLQKHVRECAECGGAGRVRQPLWFGWMGSQVECSACKGQGAVRNPCRACNGSGRGLARRYHCRARIPAGVRDRDLLHVDAQLQGGARGGEQVSLAVRVELTPHELFTLEADGTVRCEVPVDGFAWIANRWIEVPTPSGLQQMRLKRGYHTYRIKGRGFPLEDGGEHADCIVTVVPLFPEEFSKQQEARIDRLIATNSKAAGSKAASRVGAWQQALKRWQARLAGGEREDPMPPR